jgi:methylaspartate mutase epsilon subunit
MMGQLCPPAMLLALSVLEGMFFLQHGLGCLSFSYAQQTNPIQDQEAVGALQALIREYVPDVRTHVVIYTYMGVYPRTRTGARRLLAESAALAARTGATRLIVKTTTEAYRLATVADNIAALEYAASAAREIQESHQAGGTASRSGTGIYEQAKALIDNVLSLDDDLGRALVTAFSRGYLDVPFCLHPDNAGRARGYLDSSGRLLWQRIGRLPIRDLVELPSAERLTSAGLLTALRYVQRTFDSRAAGVGITTGWTDHSLATSKQGSIA